MSEEPQWMLVGNVKRFTHKGPGGRIVELGVKHFAPGAKVYCLPEAWGDGYENVRVVGKHRGGRKINIVMPSKHIEHWRAQLVYSPELLRLIGEDGWGADEEAEKTVKEWA